MATITKLFSTGVLQSAVELNEISYTSIKVGPAGVYAAQFDEVNLAAGTAERRTSTGTYMVSGRFDEYTLNAPAATGSILFNATPTQWLSVPNNTAFDQTGGFTIECWFRPTSTGTGYIWAMLQHNFLTCKWISGQFQIDKSYVGFPTGYAPVGRTYSINTWHHIAMSSNGSSGTLFINGVVEATFTDAGGTVADGNPFYIGQYQGQGQPTPQGYISNFRVVKGTAVYTSAFTPPTTALTAITNTQLLLNTTYDANFLKDNSTNNFTVTNNGSVTSVALAPF
jgi:hypothetical protein